MYLDTQRNLLIYDLKPDQIEQVQRWVPGATPLGMNGYVAVPNDLYRLQLLAYLGFPTPSVMDDYDWPIAAPWRPRDHQKTMANFMVLNPHCANLSDMGTQKTLAALWAAEFIMLQHPPGTCRALIAAPLSILRRVWGDALFTHFMNRRSYAILHGTPEQRIRELRKPVDFYIINHDGIGTGSHQNGKRRYTLDGFSKELAERPDIRIFMCDEAGAYRDHTTRRHYLARASMGGRDYVWPMTGTPTPNGPTDAFGIAKLYNNAWGETWTHYRARVLFQVAQFKWVPVKGSHVEAFKLLRPAIRFAREDCIDVPPCTVQRRDVPLSPEQKTHFASLKREAVLALEKGQITAVNEGALRLKLLQILCGAVYDGEHVAHRLDCAPRIAELKAVLDEAGGKVIVFAPFTSVIRMLHEALHDVPHAVVTGETKSKDRDAIFAAFQKQDEPELILADPNTMAHGLDLTRARLVVWYGPTDKAEIYLQANKRHDRPGQLYPTGVVQFVSHAIEGAIYDRLENNASMQGLILELARNG